MKLPEYIDLAVIGAGVQALTFSTHLLQKSAKHYRKFLVFDPSQTWMSQWQQQFAAQQIPYLRSPAVHHPDPNPHQLRTFAEHRHSELFPPYDRPGTKLFNDFCAEVIQRWKLADKVYPAKVVRVLPMETTAGFRFQLVLDTGETIVARRVVLATGNRAAYEGKLKIDECCQVSDAQWQNNLWQVLCQNGNKHQFNRIWLATGTRFNVAEHPLLSEVLKAYPTEIVNGLPVLDEHLRLPKSNFFIMGGLAALRIGPVARNIGGGKMACQRIVPAIIKPSLAIG